MSRALSAAPVVHVVIVNYRSSDFVARCLATLDPVWCLSAVVVDNSDDLVELGRLRAIPAEVPVTVVDAGANIGFGAGVNLGVTKVDWGSSEFVWVLNPDTEPEPGAAEELVARLTGGLATGAVGAVSPVVVSGERADTVWFAGGDVDLATGRVQHWNYAQPFNRSEITPYSTHFLCGAAPMFTREAWEGLGGFDQALFLYWEDVELSLRAHDLGIRFEVVPSAVVWHAVGGTSGERGQSRGFYRYSARNRALVMRRRVGIRAVLGVPGIVSTLRLAAHPLREESGRWQKFASGVRGLAEGLGQAR
jgi:N-acetylglucosaminyl-diphospho-decaprenol L-rhamnosyltransferase